MRVFTYFLSLLAFAVPCTARSADWNVVDAGAVPDGKTDNTAVFQKLLDGAGKAGGGVVSVPAGRYRISGHLVIPAAVTLQGTHHVAPTIARNVAEDMQGTVLLAYEGRGSETGEPFIRLAGSNAALAGMIVFYPEWKQTDVPPVPYPPCVLSTNTENVGISECCFANPYEAIKLVRAHRHLVRNITGYPIKRGIFVDECYDIGHIENVHFWPFGLAYSPTDPYCLWINTQGVAFELARTDWHYVSNTFCFGYGVGYKFSESATGSTNGNFLGLGADSCRRAVLVEQAQPPGLLITNGEFVGRWSSSDSVCVEIGKKVEGTVSLVNCSFWGPIDRCVVMGAKRGQFTASACHFVNWDVNQNRSPAVQVDAGRAILQGCTFGPGDLHVRIGAAAASAILLGNQADTGFVYESGAPSRTQAYANQEDPIRWTDVARAHYLVTIGGEGDGRYLRGFHGREHAPYGSKTVPARWAKPGCELRLPVVPGKRYAITASVVVPTDGLSPDAGLYLGSKRVVAFTHTGPATVTGSLPPTSRGAVVLTLRCKAWVPSKSIPGSGDGRTLGVQAMSVEMKAEGVGSRTFDANTGMWKDGRTRPTR